MKRIVSIVLVATATLAGAAVAQERTSESQGRAGASAASEQTVRVAPRRCSGVACLQNIPSIGVGF